MSFLSRLFGKEEETKVMETSVDNIDLHARLTEIQKLKQEANSERIAIRTRRGAYHPRKRFVLGHTGQDQTLINEIKEQREAFADQEKAIDKTLAGLEEKENVIRAQLGYEVQSKPRERVDTSAIDKEIRALYTEKETWEARKRELCWEPAKSLPEEARAQNAAMALVQKEIKTIEDSIKALTEQRVALVKGVVQ